MTPSEALDFVDDFIARCNGDDRGCCEPVNVIRRALSAAQPVAQPVVDQEPASMSDNGSCGSVSAAPMPQPEPTSKGDAFSKEELEVIASAVAALNFTKYRQLFDKVTRLSSSQQREPQEAAERPANFTELWELYSRVGDAHENHGRNHEKTMEARATFHAALMRALSAPQEASKPERPSPEWYARKTQETLDDDFITGASKEASKVEPVADYQRGWKDGNDTANRAHAALAASPMFWVRLLADGLYEGPLHYKSADLQECRDANPSEWHPLHLHPSPQAPCEHCDDTGDVHGYDGEWRGYCECHAGVRLHRDALLKTITTHPTQQALSAGEIEQLRLNSARWLWLLNQHMVINPLAAVSWKANGDPNGSKWVNVTPESLVREVDAAILAAAGGSEK